MIRISAAAISCAVFFASCTPLGLNTASSDIGRQAPATPPVLEAFEGDAPVTTRDDWIQRRVPKLRAAFERDVYGPIPTELKGAEISRRVVDGAFASGAGTLEEINVRVGEGKDAPTFRIALALPKQASTAAPVPLILEQNFCGNPGTMGTQALSPPAAAGACDDKGFEGRIIRLIFGAYITKGPIEDILTRGYGYATVFPSELVADAGAAQAPIDLARFGAMLPEGRRPTSAIAVWGAAFGWSIDVLDKDARIDPLRTAAFGHSRHAKSALIAGAVDPRFEVVIAHQSGKGGGTLTRSYAGETVKQITKSYPHWFSPQYAAYADRESDVSVDQHQLIAMIAPRPVLLGNGWRDVWSDPNGSFRAALGADPAYKLMGVSGLTQTGMRDDTTRGEIDFYMRSQAHGIRKVDWDYFLSFLDEWLGKPATIPDERTPG
jgi:hypothetical protein